MEHKVNRAPDSVVKPLRVLHLEDSRLDAELIEDRLRSSGFVLEVVVVHSGVQFAHSITEGPWDLILCDYSVPGYDGRTALKLAKGYVPNVPVIMISSGLSEEEAVNCLHLGATDYLLKQSLGRLPSSVEHALDQAQAQTLREQAEKKFRSLMEFAPDAMVIIDAHGSIELVNTQAEELFGYSRHELLGQSIDFLIPDRFRELHGMHIAQFFRHPSTKTIGTGTELVGLKKDQSEFPFEVRLSPLETTDGVLVIAAIRDVSERRKMESQMLRSQRLESIGTFAGNIAHDLNNALAPVLMSLELLKTQNPTALDLIETIEMSAQRGADMLKQLLVFSKGSFVESICLKCEPILEEIVAYIERSFPERYRVELKMESPLQFISGDPTQLHQVLLNLCVNARDAMPSGGCILINAENVILDEISCKTIQDGYPGSFVMWRISDSGTGIPVGKLDRIFEPFYTTKTQGRGTGLGLSIVLGIVKSHKGFVNVYSVPNHRTTFTLYLPADTSGKGSDLAASETDEDYDGLGATALLVDDSDDVRRVAKAVLKSLNFQVITASNGEEAMFLLANPYSNVNLLITDVHMPKMDGLSLVRRVVSIHPHLNILVLSGNLGDESVQEFRRLGVHAFIDKPFTQKRLILALRKMTSN